jgi:uncharacterized C2H2 Zn-finger protein
MPFVEYDEVEAVCPDCGMIFRSEEALEHHQAEVHQPVPVPRAAKPVARRRAPSSDVK